MRQDKNQKKQTRKVNGHNPIQGHYGLEFALAHLGEDLSDVFTLLQNTQKNGRF